MKLTPKRYSDWLAWAEEREKTVPVADLPAFRGAVYSVFWALAEPLASMPSTGAGLPLWLSLGRWAKKHQDPLELARKRIEAMEARWGSAEGGEA